MKGNIYVTQPSMPSYEEYCEAIRPLWESRWLTNMGDMHNELETRLCGILGSPQTVLFTNGHLALEAAIQAFGFPRGGEVITTPFTFASTTNAIIRSGLVPVFCDILADDCTLDPGKVEALVTERTVAILPVHVYGHICDVEALGEIARRHSLKLIFDAAHAFGTSLNGTPVGAFGDASMFSFHATKVFNTIEGGAVCVRDESLRRRLDDLKNFGIRDAETVVCAGGNAKMNEFQAAMGLCNLRHFEQERSRRAALVMAYRERLTGLDGITLPLPRKGTEANYSYMPVIFDGWKRSRDEVAARLAGEGIFARKYFHPLTSSYPFCSGGAVTPVAQHISENILTLPLHSGLGVEDVERICEVL